MTITTFVTVSGSVYTIARNPIFGRTILTGWSRAVGPVFIETTLESGRPMPPVPVVGERYIFGSLSTSKVQFVSTQYGV